MTKARETTAGAREAEPEAIRRALLSEARQKLRAHLAAEAAALAHDDHDRAVLADVQQLAARLDPA